MAGILMCFQFGAAKRGSGWGRESGLGGGGEGWEQERHVCTCKKVGGGREGGRGE